MKDWLINVVIKTGGPSAIRGAVLGIAGLLVAKSTLLSGYGVATSGTITTIDWSKLGVALTALLPALGAAVIKILNYHGAQAVQTLQTPPPPAPAGGPK